jgi:hypothetical protein
MNERNDERLARAGMAASVMASLSLMWCVLRLKQDTARAK